MVVAVVTAVVVVTAAAVVTAVAMVAAVADAPPTGVRTVPRYAVCSA